MYAHQQCASDSALLEDLAMSGAFPDISWQRQRQLQQVQPAATSKMATRTRSKHTTTKKKKLNTLSIPMHAPSSTIRQALFPIGPGSYPSPTMALNNSPSFDRRPQQLQQRMRSNERPDWSDPDSQLLVDNKHRETSWNTSFPAEYAKSSPFQDYQQTLAYEEQLTRQYQFSSQQQQQQQFEAVAVGATNKGAANMAYYNNPNARSRGGADSRGRMTVDASDRSPTQSLERLVLLKEVSMREGLLRKLTRLVASAAHEQDFGSERGNELLHLLLQLRDASVQVLQAIANWHSALSGGHDATGPRAFVLDGTNYVHKMVADLNFLAKTKSLGKILGVNPATMKQNPFMMPAPIPERDFVAVESLAWRKTQRTFSSEPVARVADAEKYLVWCLFHLADPPANDDDADATAASATSSTGQQHQQHPSSHGQQHHNQGACYSEKSSTTTWQKRAEKQLQMLSMPLEAPIGQTHLMDSSSMMKRKGYLPSLPLSPAKTLNDLVDTAHYSSDRGASRAQATVPRRLDSVIHLRAVWNGAAFVTSSGELEALGALESPPHHMVALVAASLLILLSPSDRIPKDLSWPSCRKLLLNGAKLVDRMNHFDVASVPPFKLKALVPFLQNEHFQPTFLTEFSRSAGALCAWVFAALASAQRQEMGLLTSRSDEDRLDLLGELELEDEFEERQCRDGGNTAVSTTESLVFEEEDNDDETAAAHKHKPSKRVTIGNAEVLFINENEPVSCSSSPRPFSRGETTYTPTLRMAKKKKNSSVLLRTSPWTFHGVTYFVSFFLEATETALSIKLYEPMSSVESQIFVTDEDLEADFGARASDLFAARDFRPLCDLILGRLDDMMTGTRLSARQQQPPPHAQATPPSEEPFRATADGNTRDGGGVGNAERDHQFTDETNDESDDDDDNAVDASVLRIQCAARQRLARDRVHHVRVEKETVRERKHSASAVMIQSLARQNLAKKEVTRMRLANRVPTGIPTDDLMMGRTTTQQHALGHPLARIVDNDSSDLESDALEERDDGEAEMDEALMDDKSLSSRTSGLDNEGVTEVGADETTSTLVVTGTDVESSTPCTSRPETSMSYGSEQFEEDDLDVE